MVCVSAISIELAHQHLGHPSLNKVCLLVPSLSTVKSLQCESCHLGKHVCHTYNPCVDKRAMSPIALVHSDNWGLIRVYSTL